MGRGSRALDSYEYDNYLASKKTRGAQQELQQRHTERKSKGYEGWHFGLGNTPVHCKDKGEFKRELDRRGLMMRDDVRKKLE